MEIKRGIFKLGSNIGGAIVIDYEGDMQNACTSFYVVKYLCCEKEITLHHRALMQRIRRGSTLCHECWTRQLGQRSHRRNCIQKSGANSQALRVALSGKWAND